MRKNILIVTAGLLILGMQVFAAETLQSTAPNLVTPVPALSAQTVGAVNSTLPALPVSQEANAGIPTMAATNQSAVAVVPAAAPTNQSAAVTVPTMEPASQSTAIAPGATLPGQAATAITPPLLPTPTAEQYATVIKVSSYGDNERQAAFGTALQQVLINLSGNSKIATLPQIKSQLNNATSLVQSFSYSSHAEPNKQQELYLKVQFNTNSIEQLLQQATQAVWSTKRPMTLVWLTMVYSPLNKTLVDDSSNDIIVPVLHKNAQNFGMPIMFPALDLQDAYSVKPEDVCNQKLQAIQTGSARYGVGSVLAGCVIKPISGAVWNSRWVFISKGNNKQWNTSGTSSEDVVTQAMLNAAQSYGKMPQQTTSMSPEEIVLRVTNVKGLDQYTEVVKYLRSLSPVTRVDLLTLDADEIQVTITCVGGKQALLTALNAQSHILPNTAAAAGAPAGVDLDYRLADVAK